MKIARGVDKTKQAAGRHPFYVSVDRRKKYFATVAERDGEYDRRVALLALGLGSPAPVTPRDAVDLEEMRRLTGGREESLMEIFRAGLARMPAQRCTVSSALKDYVAEKERAVAARQLKMVSFYQLRGTARKLLLKYQHLGEIRNPSFETWLRALPLSPKGLHSFAGALGVFLNWCVAKKLMAASPLEEIEIPNPAGKRTIFTVAQTADLFDLAQRSWPDLVPLLAVEWFAGVRPATAEKLDYSDFDRREKVIQLRVGKFAQGETEFVERIPPTLWRWLPKTKAGPIAPKDYPDKLAALRRELGYNRKNPWPNDVARHTFASHFAALTGNMEAVSFALNHRGKSTTLRFYRKRVPRADGIAYFQLKKKAGPLSSPAKTV